MVSKAKEIQVIKPMLDLLNEQFPCIVERNLISGKRNKLWEFFTAYNENGVWKITCVDYWLWISDDFNDLKEHLQAICKEEGLKVEFQWSYILTQILKRKHVLQDKSVFLGRLKQIAA